MIEFLSQIPTIVFFTIGITAVILVMVVMKWSVQKGSSGWGKAWIGTILASVIYSFFLSLIFIFYSMPIESRLSEAGWLQQATSNQISEKQLENLAPAINDHFILVNSAFNLKLEPGGRKDKDNDSSYIALNDRCRLGQLLWKCGQMGDLIDKVVIDMEFLLKTECDDSLCHAIEKLNEQRKIYTINDSQSTSVLSCLDQSEGGLVIADGDERIHRVKIKDAMSLPWKLFELTSKVKIDDENHFLFHQKYPSGEEKWAYQTFSIYLPESGEQSLFENKAPSGTEYGTPENYLDPITIGALSSDYGTLYLETMLNERRTENKMNILFIGEFPDPKLNLKGSDEHYAGGQYFHGPTLLLLTWFAFHKGLHELDEQEIVIASGVFLFLSLIIIGNRFRALRFKGTDFAKVGKKTNARCSSFYIHYLLENYLTLIVCLLFSFALAFLLSHWVAFFIVAIKLTVLDKVLKSYYKFLLP